MILGILKESQQDNRVSLLPEHITTLAENEITVVIESDAGNRSCFENAKYVEAGASIDIKENILNKSDIILKINPPDENELMRDKIYVGVFNPLWNIDLIKKFRELNITSFSLDLIPRSTRAQAMDILSSMAMIAGYKAVLEAANKLPNFFPMFMSASGTIKPAKVLVLGAGVAGLQALATARKLGAVVEVFDVHTAVKEEVMSLGGKFVEVEVAKNDISAGGYAVEQTEEFKVRQQELIHAHTIKASVIICTAQIPGKKAPLLIKKETVEEMQPGSVIIDMAAGSGGNCELSRVDETVIHNWVKIIGKANFPSKMPADASKMLGKNLVNFLNLLITEDKKLNLDFNDEIIAATCLTHNNKIVSKSLTKII